MLVLGIDSSTSVGTVSLISEEKLIGESLLNLNQTHSQRLMPQIVDLMDRCGIEPEELTGIGVARGPGSFTGTRIGMATAKTLAHSLGISIVGVSTLEILAYSLRYGNHYVCPLIDARGGRVFSCLYKAEDGLTQQIEESFLEIEELLAEIDGLEEKVYFVGQVVKEYKPQILQQISKPELVSDSFHLPRAGAAAELAADKLNSGQQDQLFALTPNYLKRSQAEIQREQN